MLTCLYEQHHLTPIILALRPLQVTGHAYHNLYNMLLQPHRRGHVKLLEIGLGCNVGGGSASIELWQSYFSDLELWMADIDADCANKVQNSTKNKILLGDQSNEVDLMRWLNVSGGGFNVIVDDGSHNPVHQLAAFETLFEHGLKPGGIYFMEDIESEDSKVICSKHEPATLSRDRILTWVDQLLVFPRHAEVDLPKGLMAISCQREMCAFHKCPADEPRCP